MRKGINTIENILKEAGFENDSIITKWNMRKLYFYNAVMDLVRIVKDGDVVFIYFGGHSGQMAEEFKEQPVEKDKKDEMLYFYDSILLDNNLAILLKEFNGKNIKLIFMLDTCTSGTALDIKESGINFDYKILQISAAQDGQETYEYENTGSMLTWDFDIFWNNIVFPKTILGLNNYIINNDLPYIVIPYGIQYLKEPIFEYGFNKTDVKPMENSKNIYFEQTNEKGKKNMNVDIKLQILLEVLKMLNAIDAPAQQDDKIEKILKELVSELGKNRFGGGGSRLGSGGGR